MKRLKIMKAYAVLWLFIYFLVYTNIEAMATFFFATLTFNLAVLTVLVIGIIVIMRASINLVMLAGTFGILAYKKENLGFYLQGIERIMPANIAHMFHSRAEKGVLLFTSEESRSVIEWIDERFSNQNRYINYFIGTSLMIGLLGTFTGLLVSIDEMGRIILSLTGDIDLGEIVASFSGPLSGMAVGFGSSLFGVVSAIILGLMGYILNKNQETLIEGVEDWLKGRIIESTGVGAPVQTFGGNTQSLPEQKNSFLDVFIDNISMLTKEMAKISQTNERLHSITIASVQQTRDEHEINYELFEAMSKSLVSIDTNAKAHATELKERLSAIESAVSSSQEGTIAELKELSTTLSSDEENKLQSKQEILQAINGIRQKLEQDQEFFTSIEKLQKVHINDTRKQTLVLEELKTEVAKEKTTEVTKQLKALEQLLNEQTQNTEITEQLKALEQLLDRQAQNTEITKQLKALEQLLDRQAQNQEKELLSQAESKEVLSKQRELLELLVGKNEENINELRRISSLQTSVDGTIVATHEIPQTQKESRGFFSKIFNR
ncbi:MAG: MotA/TolQ/ExbB proton channel family protein [Campylobacterales bacterium]|nr:MotA/TolQ/ExbB proton channel family protein [Campylobacterales bacterium]